MLERLWYGRAPAWQQALGLGLAPLSLVFRGGVWVRTLAWNAGWLAPTRVDGLTVVSVGNRLVGGSGKTPLTIFLARWAQRCGRSVAVLSRGYGRATDEVLSFSSASLPEVARTGDEPRLIARRCPGVTVWVGRDRAALAQQARAAGADFALLDDGFQHRRLARDVDLVVEPPGTAERLLPWGPFREGRSALARATLVLSEGADASGVALETAPTALVEPSGETLPLTTLANRPVVALSGIARPWRFVDSLERLGARVVGQRAFGDHHVFSPAQLEEVQAFAKARGADVVTTEKDAERLPPGAPCRVLRVATRVTHGLDRLAAALSLDPALVPPPAG